MAGDRSYERDVAAERLFDRLLDLCLLPVPLMICSEILQSSSWDEAEGIAVII